MLTRVDLALNFTVKMVYVKNTVNHLVNKTRRPLTFRKH